MHGSIIITSGDSTSIKPNVLNCESNSIDYPFFTYNNSNSKKLKINLIFSENVLKTIALEYTLSYSDKTEIIASEAHNHAAMNLSFYADNLDSDEFNAKYTKFTNSMRMTLYAKNVDIDETTTKYFLIKNTDNEEIPKDFFEYKANYEKQGFNCNANE